MPDSLSSTDGADRTALPPATELRAIQYLVFKDDDARLRRFAHAHRLGDSAVAIRRLLDTEERTRVLEEALSASNQFLAIATVHPETINSEAAKEQLARNHSASLAAVAVEDGGNGEGYERPPAAGDAAREGAHALGTVLGTVLGILANIRDEAQQPAFHADEALGYIYDEAQRAITALEPSAAGTLAAEAAHKPDHSAFEGRGATDG